MFDAFISYSHAADGRLAPALQRAIQRLAKPWYRPRALRVFRDESALTANPHLWSSIQTALDDAEWFVLLASPDAVGSEWVTREITHWLANKSADRILVVVTDGTWEWDAAAHAIAGTACPEVLRNAFADEPRHVDLRWAATETDLDMHHSRFRDVVAQLAAPMHGMAKDDLDSEDVRQHRRARNLARGGVTALTLLVVVSLVFGAIAAIERNDARNQRNAARSQRNRATEQARIATAERFGALSTAKNGTATDQALLLGVEGYQRYDSPTTRGALLGALETAPQHVGFLPGPHDTVASAISPDGKVVVAGTTNGSVRFWDTTSGSVAVVASSPALKNDHIVALTFDHSGKRLFVLHSSGRVELWDPLARSRLGVPVQVGKSGALTVVASPDGRTIAVTGTGPPEVGDLGQRTALYDVVARRSLGAVDGTYDAAFSTDGSTVYAWGAGSRAVVGFSIATRKQVGPAVLSSPAIAGNIAAATSSDRKRLVLVGVGPNGCGFVCGASLVDAATGRLLANFAQNVTVDAMAMNDDASKIVIGGADGSLSIWSWGRASAFGSGSSVSVLEPAVSHHSRIVSIKFTADSRRMVTTAADGTTRLWDLSGTGTIATAPSTRTIADEFGVTVDSGDAVPRVPSALRGKVVMGATNLSHYAFAVTEKQIESQPRAGFQGRVHAFDVRTGHEMGSIDVGAVTALLRRSHPNPDPNLIEPSGLSNAVIEASSVRYRTLAIDEQGRRAVTINGYGDLVLWDLRTGQPAHAPMVTDASHPGAGVAAFSPDGSQLAVGRVDGSVVRYSLPALRQIGATFGGHASGITQISYQPKGSLVAIASADGIDLFDLASGSTTPLIAFSSAGSAAIGFTIPKDFAVFDASGRSLLTSGYLNDPVALMWSLAPSDWARAACQAAGRNLSRAEWTQLVGNDVPYHRTCSQWPAGS